jgi:predicted hydrocarbon binding protein
MPENPYLCCSPALKGVILRSMEEVIGRSGVNAVLNLSGLSFLMKPAIPVDPEGGVLISYHDLSDTQDNLEQLYGLRGGRGLALKAGRAFFTFALRQYGRELGLLDNDFRLQPPAVKIQAGLRRLARFFSQTGDSAIHLEEDPRQFRWTVENCPLCWRRRSDVPICHMQVGVLQEYFYWASGGKNYNIVETECSAAGAKACVFTIDKIALD